MILLKSFGLSRYSNPQLYEILIDEVIKRNESEVQDEILLQYALSRMASLNEVEMYSKVKQHFFRLHSSQFKFGFFQNMKSA
jgi:hypothetical protein